LSIAIRISFFLLVALVLWKGKGNKLGDCFPLQKWPGSKTLSLFFVFVLVPLLAFAAHGFVEAKRHYFLIWYGLSMLMASTLALWIKWNVIDGLRLSLRALGFSRKDLYILCSFSLCVYFLILAVSSGSEKLALFQGRVYLLLADFALVTLWPIIQETFFLGIMYVPISRITGVKLGAVLVSLSSSFSHYHYGLGALSLSFMIGILSCYIYFKFQRIIYPIVIHSFMNSLVLLREVGSI
jgi:membrane protease YdiL (CAAX protease family)